ncbi:DUF503 domain-containing protein [candidate division WOR-3 bacterium]|nr:DUF503 domain-containing protein [candidate division WOR-3 bacterium]
MSNRLFIGSCDLDLHVENCQSLKDKRRVISSLKEKLKNRFNVAVCEFGDLSLWQRAQLGVVTCGNTRQHVDSSLKAAVDYIQDFHAVSLLKYDIAIT